MVAAVEGLVLGPFWGGGGPPGPGVVAAWGVGVVSSVGVWVSGDRLSGWVPGGRGAPEP